MRWILKSIMLLKVDLSIVLQVLQKMPIPKFVVMVFNFDKNDPTTRDVFCASIYNICKSHSNFKDSSSF